MSYSNFNGLSGQMTDKSEFESKIWQLPSHVQAGLQNRSLQIVPCNLYGVKEISGKNHINVFEPGDFTIRGVRNVVQGRTEADKYIMLSKIRCRTGKVKASDVVGKSEEEVVKNIKWETPVRVVTNGEMMLAAGATTYMDKTAASVFDHPEVTTIPHGEYKVPGKVIPPQTELKLELDLVGTMEDDINIDTATGYRYFVRFDLIGAMTQKA